MSFVSYNSRNMKYNLGVSAQFRPKLLNQKNRQNLHAHATNLQLFNNKQPIKALKFNQFFGAVF